MFMRTLTALIITFAIAATGYIALSDKLSAKEQTADNTAPPERIVIGLDLSTSNPLVDDKMYAAKLAQRVAAEIKNLPLRSEVWVRTFGAYDSNSNTLRFNEIVSARNRPEKVANGVETLVANIPALIKRGIIKGQPNTNIVGFLENMTQVADCSDPKKTTFILLTDGVEESEYANLRKPSSHLPENAAVASSGQCKELQILGLGQGLGSPKETRRLREVWADWSAGDGRPFVRFVGLNDW